MLSKKIIGLACTFLLIVYANAQDTAQQVIPGRYNDKKQVPCFLSPVVFEKGNVCRQAGSTDMAQ